MTKLNDLLDAIKSLRRYFASVGFCDVFNTYDGIVIQYGCADWCQYIDNVYLSDDYKFKENILLDQAKADVKSYVEKNGLLFYDESAPGGYILEGCKGYVRLDKINEYKVTIQNIKDFLKYFNTNVEIWGGSDGLYSLKVCNEYISFHKDKIKFNNHQYTNVTEQLIDDFKLVLSGQVNIKIKSPDSAYDSISNIVQNALNEYNIIANIIKEDNYECH